MPRRRKPTDPLFHSTLWVEDADETGIRFTQRDIDLGRSIDRTYAGVCRSDVGERLETFLRRINDYAETMKRIRAELEEERIQRLLNERPEGYWW